MHRSARLELLFFGIIRPYKGLDVLLEALALLRERDVHLTVAGEVWGKSSPASRVYGLGLAGRVEMLLQYVDAQQAAELFHRADVVVLPYRRASSSGVLALAYRYGRPVLVTAVGGLPEAVE